MTLAREGSLTRDLVRLIRQKPVTEADLHRAMLFVLDTLACAYGSYGTEPARILETVAPPSKGDTARRAFFFGGISHIIEIDDLHRASVTHPGCVVIPAAWAVAEAENLGGRAFLAAVLAGYEACARVGMSVGKAHYRVFHNTSTCGPFGSAMAAAELLGLDETEAVWALGNAGTQSSGFWAFLEASAMSKHLHTARAAESGVLAALLAREGFTGADAILESDKGFYKGLCPDPDPAALTAHPDGPWELTRTSIKPWPCCRHTHPTIDAAIELNRRLAGRAVARIDVGTYRAAIDVCDRPNAGDLYSAKFSLQHCVAVALMDGRVGLDSFDADKRAAVADLQARVTLALDPRVDAAYPDAWGTAVRIETADGEVLEATRVHCKGDPENPVDEADLAVKAEALMGVLPGGASAARAIVAAVRGLVDDAPVRSLRLFASPAGAFVPLLTEETAEAAQ
jgi:2-methylcitrate dehydratase PrpD